MANLKERLNEILPRVMSKELLNNEGLGNEIGFYIFDYAPEDELEVREHIDFLVKHLKKNFSNLDVVHVDLFRLIINYLKERNLLKKAIELQRKKGNKELLKAVRPVLDASNVSRYFVEKVEPDERDLVLVSGVGGAYPLIRSHNLLSNLHGIMGSTPLVLFYPGKYSGNDLNLFGKLKESNYYRAFRLVS